MKTRVVMLGIICLSLIMPALPFVAWGARPEPTPASLEKVIEAAKKEGNLTVYASYDYETGKAIHDAFRQKYPFLKIQHLAIEAADVVTRTKMEADAGVHNVDVAGTGAASHYALIEAGLLQAVDWAGLGINPATIDLPELVTVATITYPISYNTKLVSKTDAPQKYEDLLDPKWKGKVGAWIAPFNFADLVPKLGGETVLNLVKGIAANKPVLVRSQGATPPALAVGEFYVSASANARGLKMMMDKGGPVAYNWVDPISMDRYDLGIAAKAPHPNAAKLFVKWFSSPEGIALYEKVFRRGNVFVPESPLAKEVKGKTLSYWPSDPKHFKERAEWIRKLTKIFVP